VYGTPDSRTKPSGLTISTATKFDLLHEGHIAFIRLREGRDARPTKADRPGLWITRALRLAWCSVATPTRDPHLAEYLIASISSRRAKEADLVDASIAATGLARSILRNKSAIAASETGLRNKETCAAVHTRGCLVHRFSALRGDRDDRVRGPEQRRPHDDPTVPRLTEYPHEQQHFAKLAQAPRRLARTHLAPTKGTSAGFTHAGRLAPPD
jgi:hypothetical protein